MVEVKEESEGPKGRTTDGGWKSKKKTKGRTTDGRRQRSQKSKKKTKGRTTDGRSQRRKRRAVPWMVEVKQEEENEGPYHGW